MSENSNLEPETGSRTFSSKVWDHFKIMDEKAKCLYCG
jgi:hypothetical protein